ncbi:hypothetical protein CEXT_264901 [Caerostris extrusa]|uniref:Uncharacterized protein n=1 Tax=Caerostris extrusa TaxID=172846 RepID=A0AAV4WUH6_CAEEX|nr:hypothetical protein CEXT_264901 [Caerostris extrusa]
MDINPVTGQRYFGEVKNFPPDPFHPVGGLRGKPTAGLRGRRCCTTAGTLLRDRLDEEHAPYLGMLLVGVPQDERLPGVRRKGNVSSNFPSTTRAFQRS